MDKPFLLCATVFLSAVPIHQLSPHQSDQFLQLSAVNGQCFLMFVAVIDVLEVILCDLLLPTANRCKMNQRKR